MWAMVSDTIDYGEWKTGYRTEGLVNSACSFGYKIGNGVGSALLGLILEVGGCANSGAILYIWRQRTVYRVRRRTG